MNGTQAGILPYRADAEELVGWVEARARGRTVAQLRGVHSPKTAEGVAQSCSLLGFAEGNELTERGREIALADDAARRPMLRDAVLAFPPYRALLAEVVVRGRRTVETGWIEAWWATHGYGSSASNRQEGAAVLGRLVEHAGLGRYVPGRRGHPTRIEWNLAALDATLSTAAEEAPPAPRAQAPDAPGEEVAVSTSPLEAADAPRRGAVADEVNQVLVALEDGRTARLEVPARLPRREKRRLVELLELLVAEE